MAYKHVITGIRKFNDEKVIDNMLMLLKDITNEEDVKRRYNEPANNEVSSYTLMIEDLSTQGITIKQMIGGGIVVELPWFASEDDIHLCYAFLNAVKKVHRAARITEEDDKGSKLTDSDAVQEWHRRQNNIEDILERGEKVVITGVNRDFHLDPSLYNEQNALDVYRDFRLLQWTGLDAFNVREEKRHISEDEELSILRVIDNTQDVFVGACKYIGMMQGNTCKMIAFDDFCQLFEECEEFRLMDTAQFLLDKMEDDDWNRLYEKANGIVRENFRKTFIMRWNTDVSNYKLSEFEEAMDDFDDEGFYYDWSIWDYQKAHIGDRFYMIRTGEGEKGVVMRGSIIGTPYPDEDWSRKGRKVYYIRMSLSHMIHPDKSPKLLTIEELTEGVADFNWNNGHSGEILSDEQATRLEELWKKYIDQVHQETSEEADGSLFNTVFKERGWKAPEIYQYQGNHLETVFDLDELPDVLAQIGKWPGYGTSHTCVTSDDYENEEADIIAVRTGEDMGLMALLLNNLKRQRIDFQTIYPCHKGISHEVTIKKVFEWENHIEAIVWAETESLSFAFFATDYYKNKGRYIVGSKMNIDLAASAYTIEEAEREIVLDEDTSKKFRNDMGIEEEYDENGVLIPIRLSCENLVALINHNESCPDDAEFASPIEEIETANLLDKEFMKATISICHEPEETFIPLYFKSELLSNAEKGMPVRGFLWMQGQISE